MTKIQASWPVAVMLALPVRQTAQVISAASGAATVSAGSIVSIYGHGFASAAECATTIPLPLELGGVSARFLETNILNMPAFIEAMPLFYVSPTQINAQIPADVSFLPCNMGSGSVFYTYIEITTPSGTQKIPTNTTGAPAPGLFTANETGTGVAAAQFVTNLPDGTQTITNVAECPGGVGACVPLLLNVRAGTSALVLWGTGISEYATFPAGATVMAGSQPLEVFYAGASPQYVGLDQINVWLPASLAGSGVLNLSVMLSGYSSQLGPNCSFQVTSNAVTIDIQ